MRGKKLSKEAKEIAIQEKLKLKEKQKDASKSISKPKKDHYREFKRLMKHYSEQTKSVQTVNLISVRKLQRAILKHLSKKPIDSYKYAFINLKMISSTLFNAIKDSKKTNIYPVYNWSFISNLELWTEFICQNGSKDEMIQSLVSPLCLIIIDVIRLRQSTKFIPLKFHCCSMLNQICLTFKCMECVVDILMDIMQSVNFNRKTNKSETKTMNLRAMLHFSNQQSSSFEYLESIFYQIYQLLIEHADIFSYTGVFPGIAELVIDSMSKFSKICTVQMFKDDAKVLTKKMKKHRDFIETEMLNNPGDHTIKKRNADYDNFISKYRMTRLLEMKKIMESTLHTTFSAPEDDYREKQKTKDDEENEAKMNEDNLQEVFEESDDDDGDDLISHKVVHDGDVEDVNADEDADDGMIMGDSSDEDEDDVDIYASDDDDDEDLENMVVEYEGSSDNKKTKKVEDEDNDEDDGAEYDSEEGFSVDDSEEEEEEDNK